MTAKSIRTAACALCLCLALGSFGVYADEPKSVNVYVDESKVVKRIDRTMYGINYEWGGTEPSTMLLKAGTTEVNPDYAECFDGVLPQGRAAGMSANRLFWKGAIGSLEDRTLQKFWYFAPKKQTLGPVEWFKANMSVEEDTAFIYAVNLYDTQENIADLVEFLSGDGTVNYNGGVDWAAKRKALGLEKPVNIMAYELGNELDAGSEGAWDINRYLEACRKTIQTIKSVDPNAKIAVMRKTTWQDGWQNWHRELLRELGDQIDYIAAHNYYSGWSDAGGFMKSVKVIEDDIKNITGSDRIKILFTEHAGKSTSSVYGSVGYRNPHTMRGVLETAEWYTRAAAQPVIEASSYHCLISAGWSVIYSYEGKLHRSAIGDLIRICATYFWGDSLDIKTTGFDVKNEGDGPQIMASAVKTEEGINLFMVNQTDSEVTYNLYFSEGSYKPVHKAEISAPSLESDNYMQYNEISYTEEDIENGVYLTDYTVNPLSVTVLKLVPCEKDANEELKSKLSAVTALAPEKTAAVYNGQADDMAAKPIMYNDKMYVPFETAGSLFGAELYLSADGKEAHMSKNGDDCVFMKDSDIYYKNGEQQKDGAPMVYVNGMAYLPLRIAADAFKMSVEWDGRGFAAMYDDILSAPDAETLDAVYKILTEAEK